MKTRLNRRTLLKGVLGGAAISVGLPPLEIFFNTNGTALADGSGIPKRFGIFFWGNGNIPEKWNPAQTGPDYELSEQLSPLAPVKSEITVVSGMNVLTGNTVPHGSGPAGFLSGAPMLGERSFARPSVDQLIAAEIGKDTRFKSLEIGARPQRGLSYNGPDSLNPPESSPRRLFERVFVDGFHLPGSEPIIDPKLALRRSVLDVVQSDAMRVREKLGSNDRMRLDQHLQGVRDLERRLARLEENPPSLAACAVPAMPAEDPPDLEGRPQLHEIQTALTDVLRMALACDQTRVFSNFFTYPINNLLFAGASAGHHQLTHDEPGEMPQVSMIVQQIMAELAIFIQMLKDVPEGDGTLLDHCAVLCTTCVSFCRTHSISDYPIIIAGSADGALKKGIHYRSPSGENTSKVILSLMRAMGMTVASFGIDAAYSEDSLGAIEA